MPDNPSPASPEASSSTSILDRQVLLPPPPRTKIVRSLAVGAVIGLVLASVLIGGGFFPPTDEPLSPLLEITIFLAGLMVGVLLHEIGHLIAGLAVGFEFRRILVGPWMLTREASGYRFRFNRGRAFAGGYTYMAPRVPVDLRRRFIVFVAGGPLMTAFLFLPLLAFPRSPMTGWLLMANLMLFGVSAIPFERRGMSSDGELIRILSRRGPAAERLTAVLYLMALDAECIPPAKWPQQVVDSLTTEDGGSAFVAAGRIFRHLHDRETAPRHGAVALEQALQVANQMRADLRRNYFAEAAFWQARQGNIEVARAWLQDARTVKAIAQPDWDAPAMAALAAAEHKTDEFRREFGRAMAYLDRLPGPSATLTAARERLNQLSEGAAEASRATSVPSTRPPGR